MQGTDPTTCVCDGFTVVKLRGELDVCTVADTVRAIAPHAACGARIVADLTELTFMDCSSLRELMAVRVRATQAGGDLVLANPPPMILRLLSLLCATDMISACPVFASVLDAVNGAQSGLPVP